MNSNIEKGKQGFQKAYENGEALQKKVEEYFDTVPEAEQTRAGLALFLGIRKETLVNYSKRDDDLGDVAGLALTRLEAGLEGALKKVRGNPTGTIFALKNVAGWRDNSDVEVKSTGFDIVCKIPRPEDK